MDQMSKAINGIRSKLGWIKAEGVQQKGTADGSIVYEC